MYLDKYLTLYQIRYLRLKHSSYTFLRQQQHHLRSLCFVPGEDLDLAPSFPRLRLAYHLTPAFRHQYGLESGFMGRFTDIALDLYKPMAFDEIQLRCRPSAYESWDIFCVFGINPRFPTSPPEVFRNATVGNIIELIVAEGAGILPPSITSTDGPAWNVASQGTDVCPAEYFRLVLRDPAPTQLTASTVDFVLEFLAFGKESTEYHWGTPPHLVLDCYPSVFASFVSSVSAIQVCTYVADEIGAREARSRKGVARFDCQTFRTCRI